jgi:hypothetical protein
MSRRTSWVGAIRAALLAIASYALFLFLWKYIDTAYTTLLLWTSSPFIKVLKGIMLDSTNISGDVVIAAFGDRPGMGFKMGVGASIFTRDVPPTLAVLTASYSFLRRSFSHDGTERRYATAWFYASALGVLFAVDLISSVLIIARTVTMWEVQISPLWDGLGALVWVFSGNVAEDFVKTAAPFAMGFYVYLTIWTREKQMEPRMNANERE